MHKVSYSDSLVQNTRNTSAFSLSPASAESVWLPVSWWKGLASPLPLLLYTEGQLKLLKKKFMDHNLTKSCRKCSCQENVLYVLWTGQLSYEVQHITNTALVGSRGWQNCLLG
jgi:hypothetical protein